MKTKTPDLPGSGRIDESDLSHNTLFDVLADSRRRYALYYLSRKVGAVALTDLTEQIAMWEEALTRDRCERILTGLHHIHLPKLVDAGLVRYDVERETIELLATADQMNPYLDLVAEVEFQ